MDFKPSLDKSALWATANSPEVHAAALSVARQMISESVDLSLGKPDAREIGRGKFPDRLVEIVAETAAKLVKSYIIALGKD